MSLCLYKDSRFTKMFAATATGAVGGVGMVPKVPKATYALFALRDSMTIFASFNLPPLISPYLPSSLPPNFHLPLPTTQTQAQFLAPAAMQLFSTPLHLLGLDLYNRPGVGRWERVKRVGRDWAGSSVARMGRIVPAFGVGGVVNGGVRGWCIGGGGEEEGEGG